MPLAETIRLAKNMPLAETERLAKTMPLAETICSAKTMPLAETIRSAKTTPLAETIRLAKTMLLANTGILVGMSLYTLTQIICTSSNDEIFHCSIDNISGQGENTNYSQLFKLRIVRGRGLPLQHLTEPSINSFPHNPTFNHLVLEGFSKQCGKRRKCR